MAARQVLAHEIRNPLGSMSLTCALLKHRTNVCADGLKDQLRQLIDVLQGDIRRLDGLVGRYLCSEDAPGAPSRGRPPP